MTIISVKNWERFQHYKDRDPPWIKLYRDMLTSESWVLGTDLSRLLQVAITLLAARYQNAIPYQFRMLKKVGSFDCTEKQFGEAIKFLESVNFLEVQSVTSEEKIVAQDASSVLASCNTETEAEQSRAEKDMSTSSTVNGHSHPSLTPAPIVQVFEHWRATHKHPKSVLDAKREKLIGNALKLYPPDALCTAISGYRNSPFHMGKNERKTVYDDIELMLRDAKQIDAGLQFSERPPEREWE